MKILVTLLLGVAVFMSALEIVLVQHQARKLFVEIRDLEQTRDQLNEEWGRLQLEQSTWATDDRIESLARKKLGMIEPEMKSLVLLVE
ncbi:MAG: cell division protein FtsL [Gammaproteobacteria bacterium]